MKGERILLLYYEHKHDPGYSRYQENTSLSLLEFIELNYEWIESFDSTLQLFDRLHKSLHDVSYVVLMVRSKEELKALSHYRDILHEIPFLIVLSNDTPDMMALAMDLGPRYMGCWKNRKEVITTLHKLFHNLQENRKANTNSHKLDLQKHDPTVGNRL